MTHPTTGCVCLTVARIEFALLSDGLSVLADESGFYRSFIRALPTPGRASIRVHLRAGALPWPDLRTRIFDAAGVWSLFRQGEERVVVQGGEGDACHWAARFHPEGVGDIEVVCGPGMFRDDGNGVRATLNPLCYPLDQILLSYLLGGTGVIMHAAGFRVAGRGLVFAGASGAGKSTVSRLFAAHGATDPLSDDRIIVRRSGQGFAAWGTPWPGEAKIAENRSLPLDALFFLNQAPHNAVRRLAPGPALARLLPLVSIPWYDPEPLARSLAFCDELLTGVPAYELQFRPDAGALEAVTRFLASAQA